MRCGACGDDHLAGEDDSTAAARFCPRTGDPIGAPGPCGTQIDRYRVERWIGGGGLGAVYRARHAILGQEVALKLLRPQVSHDADVVGRFVREAQAAASVGNPHIVRVVDIGTSAEGRPFLAMELLDGHDLAWLLAEEAPLPIARAIHLTLQVLDGLAAAHAAGIIHRDIKPANLFLTGGPEEFLKILDFGVSKFVRAPAGGPRTRTGMVIGTPQYMSPEQARGERELDARSDLYSTGVILYQMVSGALPRGGASGQEVLLALSTDAPVPLSQIAPGLPDALVAVVERAMEQDPERRWKSAADMAAALRAVQEGPRALPPTRSMQAVTSPPVPAIGPGPGPVKGPPQAALRRSRSAVMIPTVIALVVCAGVVVLLWARPWSATTDQPAVAAPAPSVPPAPAAPAVADPENPHDVAVAALRSVALPPAPTAWAREPVTSGEPRIQGGLPGASVREVLGRAAGTLDACRVVGREERVRLRIALSPAGRLSREPFPANEADRAASACAFAEVVRAWNLPPFPKGATVFVEIDLAPR